jgi:hypothetical protein
MPPRSSHRQRFVRVLRNLAIVLAAGCIGPEASYSPEEDDAAIAAVASTWSASSPALSLSLCEDVDAPEPDNTCQVEHAVRGGGRGRRHEERHGSVGCGGCPFGAAAFVRGTVSGAGLAGTAAVAGEVTLGSFTDDPYAFPYHVELRCVDPGQDCFLTGTLHEDGTLELTTSPDFNAPAVTLARTGAATCP